MIERCSYKADVVGLNPASATTLGVIMIDQETIKKSVLKNNINLIYVRDCSLCSTPLHFVVEDETLKFDSNCNCVTYTAPLEERSWNVLAEWVNMQKNLENKKEILKRLGITE